MIIGTFNYDQSNDSFLGDIVTLGFSYFAVEITSVDKNGTKEPDYRVTAPTDRAQVELGAGWKRVSDRGREFVSLSLDGPLLAMPLNAALFTDDDGKASLVWNRPKPGTRAKAGAAPEPA